MKSTVNRKKWGYRMVKDEVVKGGVVKGGVYVDGLSTW